MAMAPELVNEDSVSVEVRDSNIHGRGVFATRDIKEGELVCVYEGELRSHAKILKESLFLDKEYWMSHRTNSSLILCGYKTPQTKLGVGQIINDAKKPDIKTLDFKDGIKACEDYVKESIRMTNVSFLPDKEDFHLYALRDIKKDEELLLHYGYKIWLSIYQEELHVEEDYMWRLLYWALDGETTGLMSNGQTKLFKIADAYNFEEEEYKCILKTMLKISSDFINQFKIRLREKFSYGGLFSFFLDLINIDYVESFLD